MIELHNRALLAPMSGVTDPPFRRLAHRLGAGMVVAEMAAGKLLNAGHDTTLRRIAALDGVRPHVVQIMGRHPEEMATAAAVAADCGADMVDINFGCPARKVVGGQAGSALLREPALALAIVEAVVAAVVVPVSVKLRLGWDQATRNAAEIARQAEEQGARMFFVHGRTRNQFYEGKADWNAIAEVVDAVQSPVYANGDIRNLRDVEECLFSSGAHGVMIGRGALGRPWFLRQAAAHIDGLPSIAEPCHQKRCEIIKTHYEDMLIYYGLDHGQRVGRKHLGWYSDDLFETEERRRFWRDQLLREQSAKRVLLLVDDMFDDVAHNYRLAS